MSKKPKPVTAGSVITVNGKVVRVLTELSSPHPMTAFTVTKPGDVTVPVIAYITEDNHQ